MTTATTSREPQRISSLAARLDTILTDRGIDATAAPAEAPSERVTALELAEARIPPRYRDALAGHEQVAAWVDEVALAARPGPRACLQRLLIGHHMTHGAAT
ncbi:hypothetical protein [Streptomyces microflavus]|uniref:hypothetical protein n=1 Tax=Streptomyces microflavus TaxID=1919 RepID=UPI0033AEBDD6